MMNIGINGFGRIGKCVFHQLVDSNKIKIKTMNIPRLFIDNLEEYINYDSIHKIEKRKLVIKDDILEIGNQKIKLLSNRDAKELDWNTEYVIDTTGSYLTKEKCEDHNTDYVIMSAPPKDNTKTFIYGVNHDDYKGEKIVSGSSCTTNGLAPVLKLLDDKYGILSSNFTTIHSTTASQYTTDSLKKPSRINRTVFNNIIPYKTGASSSIINVMPNMVGKIHGTCIRVPTANCSLIDLNVDLNNTNVKLEDIKNLVLENHLFNKVYDINEMNLVSSDFNTTTTPSIIDIKASMDYGNGRFKLLIWYDNEWSYSAQLVRMLEYMAGYNNSMRNFYDF